MRRRVLLLALVVSAIAAIVSFGPLERRVRAAQLLSAMASEDRAHPPAPGRPVDDLRLPDGKPVDARLYGPGPEDARISIVLGHGIHHLGVEEPRLVRFAQHLADRGCRVLTPELKHLADYHVNESGVTVLRAAVEYMARSEGDVGLIGFSFAGGLSLLAAADPHTAKQLNYVASIGGYHNLHRSLRFLATHEVEGPKGRAPRRAHEYGLLVLIYQHLDEFDLGRDHEVFRALLKSWLEEDRNTARSLAGELQTKRGRTFFELLQAQKLSTLAPQLIRILAQNRAHLDELSPAKKLGTIQTEVILLHGAGDRVVPPEETLFAAEELRRADHPSYRALVTPLLEHVRVDHPGSAWEKVDLLGIVARLL